MGLEAVIERILADTEENTKTSTSLKEYIQALDSDGRLHLQHVSLVRFNPFDETGGDQSFALAMLDRNGDGVVLSSLHARELTRVYGKPVKGGRPEGYQFSEEETRAVSSALGKK